MKLIPLFFCGFFGSSMGALPLSPIQSPVPPLVELPVPPTPTKTVVPCQTFTKEVKALLQNPAPEAVWVRYENTVVVTHDPQTQRSTVTTECVVYRY